ncbi:ubiquitin carboxyl-terminal hydrolase 47-like isoform X1 [Sebastes umbrosus]|uniref:ubiquitin carboxyl-terminal hydrolase 47-like isoform X1 n=1 Tax=Sebastes umbrosus TaxID=72105 RepID=UPI00189E3559|nr:ubiquitin carboxyl-terminal hydrolase 47-like isoform X1 [Sebastes umbrosus]XP_037614547.1 ubiquitin carboxyl-terminal hydrolase 47-like isoform X1 [Sebastes umbrosus]XP_037614548.1 ubiquitin carboxyl-terminal hydrolase 47-like isoform X1 [Sebastes umbrosus]XP_037614549.1 ubiquitin carboxyl-terminal hydrolase 47-like isoform X1 [Sebastes umbrosus]XP_037614550.1 ubiquitin carboxyl-terminal hydrolase 47-like isoform X1 [Sebastes umbrosus]XP_037614551.1 ubiquitin carboxyl-terminal hydrolase 47
MNRDRVQMFVEKLDSFTISDYHGLNSPGLTCYLNSVLQVLFMTEDFREAVKRCCSKDSATIDPQLGRLFADLQKSMTKTHNVTKKLGITDVYKQRDAAEYLEKILCLTSLKAAKIFKGELNHKTTCLNCRETNDSRNFFWILPLAVEDLHPQTYSVEKGLKAFFKREKVCGDNKMFCNRCDKKQDANFGCEITQNPEILTLLLKRFSFDYKFRCYVKLHCNVDVPQTLHMGECKYDLYALVHHFGNLTGGHYTAQIKSFETHMWYHFNDDSVNRVKPPLFVAGNSSLRSCTAYLLMYRKVSRHPGKTDEGDQEALSAVSDADAEGRHVETQRGEALVPHRQQMDGSCNGGGNLNGDILKKSHDDDTVWKKLEKQPNQRVACVRPHKEMFLQTDTGADRDSYKPSLHTQKSNLNSLPRNTVKPAFHVSSNGCSTSTHPYLTEHMQSQFRSHPVGCNYSPNLYIKSNHLKRDEEQMQHVVTADSSCKLDTPHTVKRGEITASPTRERRKAAKSRDKERWK